MNNRTAEQATFITISLLILASVAAAVALIFMRSVMIPFVLALLLSFVMQPLVDAMQDRARLPRGLAIVAALLIIAGGFAGILALITGSVAGLQDNASLYRDRLVALFQNLTAWLNMHGIDLGQAALVEKIQSLPIFDWAQKTAGGIMGLLSTTFLVLIFTIYLVTGRKPPRAKGELLDVMEQKIRSYLITKLCTSAATGILVGLILMVFGLNLALVFGLMAFLLNFIPSFGSIIATLLPLPLALMQFESTTAIIMVILLPGAVQMTVGNVIEPKLMGDSMDLHPITILLALMFWGLIWGIVGMLLATPITAVLKVVLERFETTRPVAALLAGRRAQPESC